MCILTVYSLCGVFFFKQKTAYEMRISDWSSDVCSSDLGARELRIRIQAGGEVAIVQVGHPGKPSSVRNPNWSISITRPCRSGNWANTRSEERRVGKACVSKCRSRCTPYH